VVLVYKPVLYVGRNFNFLIRALELARQCIKQLISIKKQ